MGVFNPFQKSLMTMKNGTVGAPKEKGNSFSKHGFLRDLTEKFVSGS